MNWITESAIYCKASKLIPLVIQQNDGMGKGSVERWNGGTVERWNGGTVERWNGGTAEYLRTQNDGISQNAKCLLVWHKSPKKWSCNKIRDLFIILTGEIKRSIGGNHYWSPDGRGNHEAFKLAPINYYYYYITVVIIIIVCSYYYLLPFHYWLNVN